MRDYQVVLRSYIRRFVLQTSVGPVRGLYVLLYRAMALLTARYVGAVPGVRSVYLRRGLAKGESVPGISDIDLAFITETDAEGAKQQVWERYRRAKRFFILLDESPDVVDRSTFQAQQRSTRYRYRLAEGKATWEVLYGADDRAELPDPVVDEMESSVYFELRYWWALYNRQVMGSEAARRDPIIRNAMCYKIVAEFLKIRLALEQRIMVFGRGEALERCEPFLADDERPLVQTLRGIARGRFCADDPELLDRTFAFLLRFLDRLHVGLASNPHFAEPPASGVRIDSPRREWYWPEARERYARDLMAAVDERLGPGVRAVHVAKGVDFPHSDFALLFEMDPAAAPTLEQVADLRRLRVMDEGPHARRFHLYILLPHCAVQMDVDDSRGNWDSALRGFISPLTNSDVFAAMGCEANVLRGAVREPGRLGGWTPALRELTLDRLAAIGPALEDAGAVRDWGCYTLVAQGLQLRLLQLSGAEPELLSAQTTHALLRAADERGVELPASVRLLLQPKAPGFEQANHDPAVARMAAEWLCLDWG